MIQSDDAKNRCLLSRSQRLSLSTCLCGLAALVSGKGFLVSDGKRVAFRHRRRTLVCRARSRPKESWQMRSQLMAGRSGRVSSSRRRMYGRSGATSLRVCTANTSRRSMRRIGNGILAHRPRTGEKRVEEIKRLRVQVELFNKQQES